MGSRGSQPRPFAVRANSRILWRGQPRFCPACGHVLVEGRGAGALLGASETPGPPEPRRSLDPPSRRGPGAAPPPPPPADQARGRSGAMSPVGVTLGARPLVPHREPASLQHAATVHTCARTMCARLRPHTHTHTRRQPTNVGTCTCRLSPTHASTHVQHMSPLIHVPAPYCSSALTPTHVYT